MTLNISADVSLTDRSTLGLKSNARHYTELTDIDQIPEILSYAKTYQLPILWLGGGSNLVLGKRLNRLVVRVALKGCTLARRESASENESDRVRVSAMAGENWHELVLRCAQAGAHGLENLALIPGTVGAAPVQNIGAYGVEVGQWIESIDLYDLKENRSLSLSAAECRFSYRNSLFKQYPDRYLILQVHLLLESRFTPIRGYQALDLQLEQWGLNQPNASEQIEAVCAVRRSKLPDPDTLSNAGSFFQNPIISQDQFDDLQSEFPKIPHYPDPKGVKLAAGWLIEQAGWRGRDLGPVGMYEKQALVLVNRSDAELEDVQRLSRAVVSDVQQKFGVTLEQEPQTIL